MHVPIKNCFVVTGLVYGLSSEHNEPDSSWCTYARWPAMRSSSNPRVTYPPWGVGVAHMVARCVVSFSRAPVISLQTLAFEFTDPILTCLPVASTPLVSPRESCNNTGGGSNRVNCKTGSTERTPGILRLHPLYRVVPASLSGITPSKMLSCNARCIRQEIVQ